MQDQIVTIRRAAFGDYRVPAPCRTEAAAYYTDDPTDALDTARKIWIGHAVTFRIGRKLYGMVPA